MKGRPLVTDSRRGRPLVAVSSCLLGEPVRYDGGHKYESAVAQVLGGIFELLPVCPELEVGMGVPREPVRLEGTTGVPWMIGVESRRDWTGAMRALAERRALELAELGADGYVFKARSPSCGLRDVPIHEGRSATGATGRGLYARILTNAIGDLPVADEDEVRDEAGRARFIEAVRARHSRRMET